MKMASLLVPVVVCVSFLASCQHERDKDRLNVKTLHKSIDYSRPGYEICSSFSLTRENVEVYFSLADEVETVEFSEKAVMLPCRYRGELIIQGKLAQWEISAGGAGYLYQDPDSDKRYLCGKKCCAALPGLC